MEEVENMEEAAEQMEKLYKAFTVNSKAARRHGKGMLQYLQSKFPLPEGAKVELILQESKTTRLRSGKGVLSCNGKISVSKKSQVAKIKVAIKGKSPFQVITTVAHEYRHALQVFVEDRTLSTEIDHPTEVEARVFGNAHRLDYVYSCSNW